MNQKHLMYKILNIRRSVLESCKTCWEADHVFRSYFIIETGIPVKVRQSRLKYWHHCNEGLRLLLLDVRRDKKDCLTRTSLVIVILT